MYRPSGETATECALPLSVNLAICMFCRLSSCGRFRNLYAPKARQVSTTMPAIKTGFASPRFVGIACEAAEPDGPPAILPLEPDSGTEAIEPLCTVVRPELVSRLNRFKS